MKIALATCLTFLAALCSTTLFAQPVIPTTHPRVLLVGAELQRLRDDLTNNVPAATRFRTMVDGEVAGSTRVYAYQPWYSAMIGVIRGNATFPQYCVHAVQRTEAFVVSEEALINAGMRPTVAGDSYLEVGDFVGNVALVYDWCYDVLTASQRTRWMNYASRAVTNVWNPNTATWGGVSYPWTGFSIDDPGDNYYYSFLRATMLYGIVAKYDRTDADGWLTHFRTTKIQNQLVPIFERDNVGGGSREGTGYGTAMKNLFYLYYLWEKSTGDRIADLTSHTAATMPYLLHSIAPTRDRFAPIGDHARDETATLYDYQREALLALAKLYQGTPMARRVRADLALSSVTQMADRFNYVFDYLYNATDTGAAADLNTVYRGPGTGHMFARTSWATNATWLSFLSGPFTQSHAHQDGLSILLYKNGWLVNDANMTGRSGIWQEQEAHALVAQTVGGTLVRMWTSEASPPPISSGQLTALSHRPLYLYSSANAGTLFNHPNTGNPGVQSNREIIFLKPDVVVVFDRVRYTPGSSLKTFQLPTLFLPTISGRTATVINPASAGKPQSSMTLHAVSPTNANLAIRAMSSVDSNFTSGHRIDVSLTSTGETKFMNVLSVDNAAATVTGSLTDSGEVTIVLNDGRTAIVRFNAASPGGSIEIRNSSNGQVILSEPFASTVETLAVTIPTQETLTVSRNGTGIGTVTSTPAGIACGNTCSALFNIGSTVTLAPTATAGSVFAGWSGGGCSGTGPCQLNFGAATTVTATFNLVPLTVPGAPTQVVGFAGNARATLRFSPPISNGGSAITSYTVTCDAGGFTANGSDSPIAVAALNNGTGYNCSVTAANSVGTGPASVSVSVTPNTTAALTLVSVQSRKTHGSTANFNIPIDTVPVIGGAVSMEPRAIGAGHKLVFQFNDTVMATGSVATVGASAVSAIAGNEVIVTLNGISDNQRASVSLTGVSSVNGTTTNAFAALGFLVGDLNNTRSVTASDISSVKARSGQPTNSANFRFDVNASGNIDSLDISAVKARSGLVVP